MKTSLLLTITLIISSFGISQVTLVPDLNFEQRLISYGYDSGVPDGMVLTSNIDTVDSLYLISAGINDLTGIEDFASLEYLSCSDNNLSTLDLSQCSALSFISCDQNQLSNLDIGNLLNLEYLICTRNNLTNLYTTTNPSLRVLQCFENYIITLDLTQNDELEILFCSVNELTELDLSQNAQLSSALVNSNQLSCLNIKNGNNTSISSFSAYDNSSLSCIEVDNQTYSTLNWTFIDSMAAFSSSCSNNCSSLVGLVENIFQDRSLVKITDLLGRTIENRPNVLLIYYYSDGSFEKKVRFE